VKTRQKGTFTFF